jgi:glycosyltransferase involved in cell wall biosynthesis
VSEPLRVGLNLVYLNEKAGGAGTYARELVPAMLAAEPGLRLTAFVSREVPDDFRHAPWASEVEFVTFPVTVTHGPPGNFALSGGAQWVATPLMALRRRLHVVHGLANIVPLLQPRAATVATLLDLIWLEFPKSMERSATVGMKLTALPSALRADRLIAISHAAKGDIVRRLGVDPERIDVTHLGVRLDELPAPAPEGELRRRLGLGQRPVVLCVAQKREHKNLDNLVRAVAGLEDDAVLVLVGSPTPYEQRLRELASELGASERVLFCDWLSGPELEGLYALAACFVLPSLMEGFGLPLLEAMRRDVPVACSNASSMPEVAGDAALLFDPFDPGDMRGAISRLLAGGDRRERLIERGRERCRTFTWEGTAQATLEAYRRAVVQRRGPVPRLRDG